MDAISVLQSACAAFEAGDEVRAGSLMTDDFTFNGPLPEPIGKEAYVAFQAMLIRALPDWKFNLQNLTIQGNTVIGASLITGTHTATLQPIQPGMPALPPTGIKVTLPVEPIKATMRGDKIARFEVTPVPGGGVPGLLAQIGIQMPQS